jgi:signal transduction histidine kinase
VAFRSASFPPCSGAGPSAFATRYQALVEQLPVIAFRIDLHRGWGEVYVSPKLGSEWIEDAATWYQRIHPDDKDRLNAEYAAMIPSSQPFESSYRIIARDGRVIWFRCEVRITRQEDDRTWHMQGVAYMAGAGAGVHERERLERAMLEISAREQLRIGQELHDGLGQILSGIAFLCKTQQNRLAAKSLPEAADAANIVALVNEAIRKTGELARGLVPAVSEAHGLVQALRQRAATVEALFQVSCHIECSGPFMIQDRNLAQQLHQIAFEAVNNAIKHGKAKHIVIGLGGTNGHGSLTIEDDGSGLPQASGSQSGLGLRIMSYRARTIGGSLDVQERSGGGVRVTCRFHAATHNDSSEAA